MGAKLVGARVRRVEDPRLLRGQGAYVDDIQLPGLLHMAVLRSPYPHAAIRRADLMRARSLPGVVDAFTLDAFGEQPPAFPVLLPPPDALPAPQYPLARGRARYIGEGIAVVLAETRSIAEDGLELIQVDYEVLEPIASPEAALAEASRALHEGVAGNRYAAWTSDVGDVELAFREADVVVAERLAMQRYTAVPIETEALSPTRIGSVASWSSGHRRSGRTRPER